MAHGAHHRWDGEWRQRRYRAYGTAGTGAFELGLHNEPNSSIATILWSPEHHRWWPTTMVHGDRIAPTSYRPR
jgi:hypothetical protein